MPGPGAGREVGAAVPQRHAYLIVHCIQHAEYMIVVYVARISNKHGTGTLLGDYQVLPDVLCITEGTVSGIIKGKEEMHACRYSERKSENI